MGSTGRYPVHNQRSSFSPHSQPAAGVALQTRNPNRAVRFAGAGERRQRASSLKLALPPVATRNGLAPPRRIGAPTTPEHPSKTLCIPINTLKSPTNCSTDPQKEREDFFEKLLNASHRVGQLENQLLQLKDPNK
jgi:hypothetical protein